MIATEGFLGGSDGKGKESTNAGDTGLITESGRSPGEVNGLPLQYSCLENSTDREAWWAAVHGVAKIWTRLSTHACTLPLRGRYGDLGHRHGLQSLSTMVQENGREDEPNKHLGRSATTPMHREGIFFNSEKCSKHTGKFPRETEVEFSETCWCFQRRQWHPNPVLLPGKSHGQRSLAGCSPWGQEESDTTERLHFHFSLACIGEGNGSPLQCSCLENPRDGGAWWAAVYGVAQSRTRLKRLSSGSSRCFKGFYQEGLLKKIKEIMKVVSVNLAGSNKYIKHSQIKLKAL